MEPATNQTVLSLGSLISIESRVAQLLCYLRTGSSHQIYVRYVVEELGVDDDEKAEQTLVAAYGRAICSLRGSTSQGHLSSGHLDQIVRRELQDETRP